MAGVTAPQARFDTPEAYNIQIGTGVPLSGATINVGDPLAYSGTSIFPTYMGQASTAYGKASAAGVALESNPTYDPAGRVVQNTGLRFIREGVLRVTAAYSGNAGLGQGVYPVTTGSGVAAPTGGTGVGATWQTGIKLSFSGNTAVGASGWATLIGSRQNGNAGTAELDILLLAPRPEFY